MRVDLLLRQTARVTDRVGVVSGEMGGQRRLLLPDGSTQLITDDMTDETIVARFDLDAVRHAASLDWCSGVCLDGPMSGESVYAINRIGSRVTVKSSLISAGTTVMYEVVTLASGESPADLRVVAPASSPD
jgi:hypothetical protein